MEQIRKLTNSLVWEPVQKEEYKKLKPNEKLQRVRHSCSHLLAHAVQDAYSSTLFAIGPATQEGFFYDIEIDESVSQEFLSKVQIRVEEICKLDIPFEVTTVTRKDAAELFEELDQRYKLEILKGIVDDTVTLYRVGDFVDLCAGPHVPSSNYCKAFKILNSSAAHWRGEDQPSLTRISGTAWLNAKDLKAHLKFIEEAKARDHRVLGPELDLFTFHEWAASALWHPNGLALRKGLERLWRDTMEEWDYEEILNPLLYRKELYETSGHWDHFNEDMFVFREENGEPSFALKPMNCPDTMLYFKSRSRSYRELPLRVAEGQVLHRNENSGSLHGIMRGRNFVQDDAHIFLSEEQIQDEIKPLLKMLDYIYGIFDLTYDVSLSTRPEKFMGDKKVWARAEDDLREALADANKTFTVDEGEGAFYGPKIDITIFDSLGRSWQCGTFQLDFQLPERFDLHYVNECGERFRPIVIHRAIFGSFERFLGVLIEHFNGKFPTWLAPIQVTVLPVSDKFVEYGKEVLDTLRGAGIKVELSTEESLNYRIRSATKRKVPNILVIGEREMEAKTVSLRKGKGSETLDLAKFCEDIKGRIASRSFDVVVDKLDSPTLRDPNLDGEEGY